MKKFALFLPQFHEIPENDAWWGKGYTEWTNVKSAKPFYSGHIQPKAPLNDNYYDLRNKETVTWQTQLMHDYKIDGLAYYHFYSKGKKLLEKPAENLLHWKEIDQKFFFVWANHDWYRTRDGKKTLIMKQEYGSKEDWEIHFQYLLKFFNDSRYEKKNNMPIFGVFNPFPGKEEIFKYFNSRCIQEGFSGIYIFECYASTSILSYPYDFYRFEKNTSDYTSAIHIRQPITSIYERYKGIIKWTYACYRLWMKRVKRKGQKIVVIDGNKLIDDYLNLKQPVYKKEIIPGIFFEWDNTARHKNRGYVITPIDKNHFYKWMNHCKENEYVLFNAWNEWAEYMVLEPSKENGYKYLEWIKQWSEENII